MKLVDFEEFCRMPAGTIFAPYTPCILEEELAIKVDPGEEMPADYPYYRHSFNGVMPLQPWLGNECKLYTIGDREDASFEIYDGDTNDYMDYKMFLIFEEADIDRMINALIWAKNGCKGECNCSKYNDQPILFKIERRKRTCTKFILTAWSLSRLTNLKRCRSRTRTCRTT